MQEFIELKTDSPVFKDAKYGNKLFEIRKTTETIKKVCICA